MSIIFLFKKEKCIYAAPKAEPRYLIGSKTVRIFIVSNEILSYDTAGKRHEYFEQQIPCFSVTGLHSLYIPRLFVCMLKIKKEGF